MNDPAKEENEMELGRNRVSGSELSKAGRFFRSLSVVRARLVQHRPGNTLRDAVEWTEMCVIA